MNLVWFLNVYISNDELLLLLCFASVCIMVLDLIDIGAHSQSISCLDIFILYSSVSIN